MSRPSSRKSPPRPRDSSGDSPKAPSPPRAADVSARVGGVSTVTPELAGSAIDAIVRTLFEASWGQARAWIEAGKVTVDGNVLLDTTRRVRAGVSVVLNMAAPRPRKGGSLGREAVVHVDPHVVVVDKPPGISTVPFDGIVVGGDASRGHVKESDGTLDALVRDYLARTQRLTARAGGRAPLGVVHRIDKETSGLVVFTRTWLAKQSLSSQFRAHSVHRRYFAIVHGRAESRTFETHLVENRGDGLRGSVEHMRGKRRGEQGQRAVTHIEVVERLAGGATLVACRLETGRTHQIRIHLAEVGNPLVGERVYIRGFAGPEIVAPRLMLHAAELGFVHPATEQPVHWERALPKDIEETLARLRLSPT